MYKARHVKSRMDTAYVAMLQFAALAVGATLPPAALSLALHTYLHVSRALVVLVWLVGSGGVVEGAWGWARRDAGRRWHAARLHGTACSGYY